MKRFEFRLTPLLELRRMQCDQLRRALADGLRQLDELIAQKITIEAERSVQVEEIRESPCTRELDVEANHLRRAFAVRLKNEITRIDEERQQMQTQIDACRASLLRADQGVKSLEKLEERRMAEFSARQERCESQQHEETWQAIRAAQHASR